MKKELVSDEMHKSMMLKFDINCASISYIYIYIKQYFLSWSIIEKIPLATWGLEPVNRHTVL